MVLIRSLYLALICTIVCLLLGYPVSMILASKEYRDKESLFSHGHPHVDELPA